MANGVNGCAAGGFPGGKEQGLPHGRLLRLDLDACGPCYLVGFSRGGWSGVCLFASSVCCSEYLR